MLSMQLKARVLAAVVYTLCGSVGVCSAQEQTPEEPEQPDTPMPLAPLAPPQPEDPEAKAAEDAALTGSELFALTAEAIGRAQAVSYRCKSYGTGDSLGNMTAKTQADVRLLRSGNTWHGRSTGSGIPKANAEEVAFDVAWLAGTVEWVDHAAQKVFEKRQREARGQSFSIAGASKLEELVSPTPFNLEIDAASIVMEGRQDVGGTMCEVLLVSYADKRTIRWALGVEDRMPRRKERIIDTNIVKGSIVLELDDLTVDESNPPRITPELLRVQVPDGYTEERIAVPPPPPASVARAPDPVKPTDPSGMTGTTPAPQPAAPAPPATPALRQGPDFELAKADGEKVSLSSLRGSIVVLEFAGSWCLPCRQAHPELQELQVAYDGKAVRIFTLSVREKVRTAAADDLAARGRTFAALLDADAVAKEYGVRSYPTYFVLGPEGEVLKHIPGYTRGETIAEVKSAVDQALDQLQAK